MEVKGYKLAEIDCHRQMEEMRACGQQLEKQVRAAADPEHARSLEVACEQLQGNLQQSQGQLNAAALEIQALKAQVAAAHVELAGRSDLGISVDLRYWEQKVRDNVEDLDQLSTNSHIYNCCKSIAQKRCHWCGASGHAFKGHKNCHAFVELTKKVGTLAGAEAVYGAYKHSKANKVDFKVRDKELAARAKNERIAGALEKKMATSQVNLDRHR